MKCREQGDIDEKATFSIQTMKMLAKATAIFIPMAVPWVYRRTPGLYFKPLTFQFIR